MKIVSFDSDGHGKRTKFACLNDSALLTDAYSSRFSSVLFTLPSSSHHFPKIHFPNLPHLDSLITHRSNHLLQFAFTSSGNLLSLAISTFIELFHV
ncbi:hypothetical protein L1887_10427 [Cichorium endivia]|nr:hypothetical protein L1887_10427 [Cichorium endivia]